MAATKNKTKAEREKQVADVARLYLARHTMQAIGDQLGVTKAQVFYDLKKCRAQWVKDANSCFDTRKAEELARIDRLENEYWEAWRGSLEEFTSTTKHAETAQGGTQKQRATVKTEARNGDPRYLSGVQWCIQKRTEILGLDAPQKNEVAIADTTNARDKLRNVIRSAGVGVVANGTANGIP
jgi:hypothetical protein